METSIISVLMCIPPRCTRQSQKAPGLAMDMPSFQTGNRQRWRENPTNARMVPIKQHRQFKPCAHSRQHGHGGMAIQTALPPPPDATTTMRGMKRDQEQDKPRFSARGRRPTALGHSFQRISHTAPEAVPEVLLLYHAGKNTSMLGMPIRIDNTTASTRPSLVTGRRQSPAMTKLTGLSW